MDHLSSSYHKKFYLLCEECNCLNEQSVSVFFNNVEFGKDFYMEFTNEYWCKHCQKPTFQFDVEPGIAKSVRLLRLHGFKTKFSCEGHGQIENASCPYICFEKRELPKKFESILDAYGWKVDKGFEVINDNNLMRICVKGIPDKKYAEKEEWEKVHSEYYKEADEKLFKALLEIFIEE